MRILALFLLLSVTVCGGSGVKSKSYAGLNSYSSLPVSDKAAEFDLKDQYNKSFSVNFPKDNATILVFGDRAGSAQIEGWVRPLVDKYADKIDIYGIAELSAVPGIAQGIVRQIMKNQVKYSVMLDWSGDVSKAYGYQKGRANLFVIDKYGNITAKRVGAANNAELEQIYREINRVF